jgi:hypothetical protein
LGEALRISPDHTTTRFYLVQEFVAAGQFADASRELEALLGRDLFSYLGSWRQDPNLAPLRQSSEARRVDARIAELEMAWQQVLELGVEAFLWLPHSQSARDGAQGSIAQLARPGIYVHGARRFFPLGPAIKGTAGGMIDLANRKMVIVQPRFVNSCGVICYPIAEVRMRVDSIPPTAKPAIDWTFQTPKNDSVTGLSIQPTPHGIRFRPHDSQFKGGVGDWIGIGSKGKELEPSAPGSAGVTLFVDNNGVLVSPPDTGYRVRAGKFLSPNGTTIQLSAVHRAVDTGGVVLDPSGRSALVLSQVEHCDCGVREGPVVQYSISAVDLSNGTATFVEKGPGRAIVRQDKSGAVYVQTEVDQPKGLRVRVRRWPSMRSIRDVAAELIMDGVVLSPPRRDFGACCGA